jgi:hypothetical protein
MQHWPIVSGCESSFAGGLTIQVESFPIATAEGSRRRLQRRMRRRRRMMRRMRRRLDRLDCVETWK